MAAQWQDCAARRDYTFIPGGLFPPHHHHHAIPLPVPVPVPLPPPAPGPARKRSFLDRIFSCLSCECVYDPVPAYPPGTHLACVSSAHPASCAGGACTSPGTLDSRAAKAHCAEMMRLAKLNEKAYAARAAAEAKEAARKKKEKEQEEAKKKKDKERAEAEAKRIKSKEEAAKKREMAKFQAWASRNGCTAVPQPPPGPSAPGVGAAQAGCVVPFGGRCVCPVCCQTHVFMAPLVPQDWGVARQGFVDAFGVAWPQTSHTMMQAIRENNREEQLLRIANSPCR